MTLTTKALILASALLVGLAIPAKAEPPAPAASPIRLVNIQVLPSTVECFSIPVPGDAEIKVVAEAADLCPAQKEFWASVERVSKEFNIKPERLGGLTVTYIAALMTDDWRRTFWGYTDATEAKIYVSTVSPHGTPLVTAHELRHAAVFMRYVLDNQCIDEDKPYKRNCAGMTK